MPRKTSAKLAADRFIGHVDTLNAYVKSINAAGLSSQELSWAHEAALIKLAAGFEQLMLEALVCAINNNTTHVSTTLGVNLPKHLTHEVCEYLVTGGGYFDYKGRDGLLGEIKKLVGKDHYLYGTVKAQKYKDTLNEVVALRNYAAHESTQSKRIALTVLNRKNLGSAGSYLKVEGRFERLSKGLATLAADISTSAPY